MRRLKFARLRGFCPSDGVISVRRVEFRGYWEKRSINRAWTPPLGHPEFRAVLAGCRGGEDTCPRHVPDAAAAAATASRARRVTRIPLVPQLEILDVAAAHIRCLVTASCHGAGPMLEHPKIFSRLEQPRRQGRHSSATSVMGTIEEDFSDSTDESREDASP